MCESLCVRLCRSLDDGAFFSSSRIHFVDLLFSYLVGWCRCYCWLYYYTRGFRVRFAFLFLFARCHSKIVVLCWELRHIIWCARILRSMKYNFFPSFFCKSVYFSCHIYACVCVCMCWWWWCCWFKTSTVFSIYVNSWFNISIDCLAIFSHLLRFCKSLLIECLFNALCFVLLCCAALFSFSLLCLFYGFYAIDGCSNNSSICLSFL